MRRAKAPSPSASALGESGSGAFLGDQRTELARGREQRRGLELAAEVALDVRRAARGVLALHQLTRGQRERASESGAAARGRRCARAPRRRARTAGRRSRSPPAAGGGKHRLAARAAAARRRARRRGRASRSGPARPPRPRGSARSLCARRRPRRGPPAASKARHQQRAQALAAGQDGRGGVHGERHAGLRPDPLEVLLGGQHPLAKLPRRRAACAPRRTAIALRSVSDPKTRWLRARPRIGAGRSSCVIHLHGAGVQGDDAARGQQVADRAQPARSQLAASTAGAGKRATEFGR